MALGAATVLHAGRARLADGEPDVTGGVARDVEVLAQAADRAASGGDVLGNGGQKQVEGRGHAGISPLRCARIPNHSIEVRRPRGRLALMRSQR